MPSGPPPRTLGLAELLDAGAQVLLVEGPPPPHLHSQRVAHRIGVHAPGLAIMVGMEGERVGVRINQQNKSSN